MSVNTDDGGSDDVRRRIRFDADADLRLLQAVYRREPFAADHGNKLKAWDEVAEEVYATATKLRDVPSSRRAVTDRFHHLLQRHEQGTLKLKRWSDTPGGEEKAVAVQTILHQIASHMADMKTTKKPSRTSLSSLPDESPVSRKRTASSMEEDTNAEQDVALSVPASVDDDKNGSRRASNDGVVHKAAGTSNSHTRTSRNTASHSTSAQNGAVSSEILALKREKLALKRHKLDMLQQHHDERMALEQRRLELEEKRLEEVRFTRKAGAAGGTEASL